MGKAQHLQRRGLRLYFRLAIPKDVQRFFNGKRELKRSLKTARYNDATAAARVETYRAERLFAKLRGGFMNQDEMRRMVSAYFESTMALAEDARADGSGVLSEDNEEDGSNDGLEGLDLHLSDLMDDLARGNHKGVAHVADSILDCAGITLDKGSHEYRVLCREALKGVIAATKVQLERMTGHYPEIRRPSGTFMYEQGGRDETSSSLSAAPRVLLSEALAEFVKEHNASGHWRPKTREETEGVFRLLVGIVGDRDVSELDYKVISKFRDSLIRFPSNHTKRPAYREKTISEIVIMTASTPAASPLSVSSVNKHIIRTGAFLKWAVRRGYVAANYAEGLTITKKGKASEEREAYSSEDLVKLVQSLLAGGVKLRKTHPERFWIPILGLYSGARLNELCQLHLEDIIEKDGGSGLPRITCLDINSKGEKTLKNVASRRVIPVHPILMELGFKDYVKKMREKGELRLWPSLRKKRGGFSQDFGKWFQRWNRQYVSKNPKRVFHSLRHSLADNLKQRGVDGNIIAEILGHSLGSMSLGRYGKGYEPPVLLDVLKVIDYGVEEALARMPRFEP